MRSRILFLRASLPLLGLISVGALGGALVSQYWGGLQPCDLCLWQRVPHAAIILLGFAGIWLPGVSRLLALLIALAAMIGAGIALYHVGVEQHWWGGFGACTAGAGPPPQTLADLQAMLEAAPLVPCDQVAWSLLGISMAGYNVLVSLLMAAIAWMGWSAGAPKKGSFR